MGITWVLPEGARTISLGYLQQIAEALDRLGYTGALLPTGRGCEDAWIVASLLVPRTERLKFLVAVRPGFHDAGAGGPDGGDARSVHRRPVVDQRGGGRRFGGVGRRRRVARSRCPLRFDGRVLGGVAGLCRGERVQFEGEHVQVHWRADFGDARVKSRTRHCTSAGRLPRRTTWRPSTATCISLGVSRRKRWPRSWTTCGGGRPTKVAKCGSAFGCTRSCARPRKKPGQRPRV